MESSTGNSGVGVKEESNYYKNINISEPFYWDDIWVLCKEWKWQYK